MKRREDWDQQLNALVERRRHMPFRWGFHDCCQFARYAVEAQTGSDPAQEWKLRSYKTASGAARELRRLGGLENLPARAGAVEIRVTLARRGDIVLCPSGERFALGVCLGAMTAAPTKHGLVFIPTLECSRAWRT